MANRIKKNTRKKAADPDQLVEEKEEKIEWKGIMRDERTYKILGVTAIITGIFLFIAFTSYLFTWDVDQDKVMRHGWRFLFLEDLPAANLLGRLGALVSHFFIYRLFGLAAYLVCTFFFIIGVNLLFQKKYFSIVRNLKYVFTGSIVFSILLAFLFSSSAFPWGGAFGDLVSGKITRFFGQTGTAILLFTAVTGYLIWRFNPVFKIPERKTNYEEETAARPVHIENSLDYEAGSYTEEPEPLPAKGNQLKEHANTLVNPPLTINETFSNDIQLVEKEVAEEPAPVPEPIVPKPEPLPPVQVEQELTIPQPEIKPREKKQTAKADIELEINEA
ncbi:MAG: DNA translocase FtsK 4TM domain-containing protein, partial [Dinghuibacter sp.]|nr:DNA translocase FtsK 4TM domain-containing protein [Dinghuibacter sp.]